MEFAIAFFAIHCTAMAIMAWRKTNAIFGAYVAAGLIWLMVFPILKGWYFKLIG